MWIFRSRFAEKNLYVVLSHFAGSQPLFSKNCIIMNILITTKHISFYLILQYLNIFLTLRCLTSIVQTNTIFLWHFVVGITTLRIDRIQKVRIYFLMQSNNGLKRYEYKFNGKRLSPSFRIFSWICSIQYSRTNDFYTK